MLNKPYIYALTYKGEISYIGLHNGKNKYYFSGGVIPRRMGKNRFIKGVLEYCEIDELERLEMFYIDKYRPRFNLTSGGERTSIGTKHSKETIDKRRKSFLSNTEHVNKIKNRIIELNNTNNPSIKFAVKCLNDNKAFKSIREAGRYYNIDNSYLSKHLKGLYYSVKGYRFKLMDL